MCANRIISLGCVLLFACALRGHAGYVSIEASVSGVSTTYSSIVNIGEHDVCTVIAEEITATNATSEIRYSKGTNAIEYVAYVGTRLDGPASIWVVCVGTNESAGGSAKAVVKLGSNGQLVIDSGLAVVPNDNGDPVQVVIETTTDLVDGDWIPAQPGEYGETDGDRYFRVRAYRNTE